MGAVISPSLAQVSSQVPGRVTKIWVEAGSRVKAGDPLVTLSAAEFKARVDQAPAGARPGPGPADPGHRRLSALPVSLQGRRGEPPGV